MATATYGSCKIADQEAPCRCAIGTGLVAHPITKGSSSRRCSRHPIQFANRSTGCTKTDAPLLVEDTGTGQRNTEGGRPAAAKTDDFNRDFKTTTPRLVNALVS